MKIPSRTGVTAGVTPSPQPDGQPRGRRLRAIVGLVATVRANLTKTHATKLTLVCEEVS